jgi:hypothetical protein
MGFWVGLFGGLVYADVLMVPLYAGAVSVLAVLADETVTYLRRFPLRPSEPR